MYNKNKIVIFDWGGVVESHYKNEYNCDLAISNMIKRFNPSLNENEIIQRYSSCRCDQLNRDIGTYNEIERIKEWFYR